MAGTGRRCYPAWVKSLAASNRHLQTVSARKQAVERNVRSSSAIEGVSAKVFRSAMTGRFVTNGKPAKRTIVVNQRHAKKS